MAQALARRYARALAEILFDAKAPARQVQQTKQQLADLVRLLGEHAGLRNALASPALARKKKLAVIDGLRKLLQWDQTLRNLIAVLVDNRRLDQLGAILESLDEEIYARLGIVPVEITTAVDLSSAQKKELEKRLAELTGSEVELRYQHDAGIIGGIIARMGSTIYDGSLRSNLRRLEAQLTQR